MSNQPHWKVYVMGPGVFRKDAREHFEHVRKLAAHHNVQPLIPWDPQLHEPAPIYENCVRMMQEADAGVVDLTPFRGTEPDSGSVFEAGYMVALRKPVVGYSAEAQTVLQRTQKFFGGRTPVQSPTGVFPDGMYAEDFGRNHNLMLTHSMSIRDTLNAAFATVVRRLQSLQHMTELERLSK